MINLKKFFLKSNQNRTEKQNIKNAQCIKLQLHCCGDSLQTFGRVEIFSGKNITIGNNCKINADVMLNGRSGITIGDNVTLSHGAKVISTGYDIERFMSTGERIHITDKPITIGNNCWVGANAIILPGVKITGEFVVIGAGAVVTKDVTESRVLVAGNPARIVKRYDVKNQE